MSWAFIYHDHPFSLVLEDNGSLVPGSGLRGPQIPVAKPKVGKNSDALGAGMPGYLILLSAYQTRIHENSQVLDEKTK